MIRIVAAVVVALFATANSDAAANCTATATAAESACGAFSGTDMAAKFDEICDDGDCKTKVAAMVEGCSTIEADKPAFLTAYEAVGPDSACLACGRLIQSNLTEIVACTKPLCSDECKPVLCGVSAACDGASQGMSADLEAKTLAARTASTPCLCPGSAGAAIGDGVNKFKGLIGLASAAPPLAGVLCPVAVSAIVMLAMQ